MATTRHDIKHIVSTPEIRSGRPRIDGHRITVADIALAYEGARGGWSIERVADEFGLPHSKVHAALSYYYDHREVVDGQIDEDEAAGINLLDELGISGVKEWVDKQKDNS